MELLALATTALTLSLPYLKKGGEKFAEKVGEDLWALIKAPFTSDTDKELIADINTPEKEESLKKEIIKKLADDPVYFDLLLKATENAQQQLNNNLQQNVNNNAPIQKQVNIGNNSGDITF